ncbi:MAG TPA: hypothetical protein VGC10_08705 [Sphingomonas sp.]
MKRVCLCLSLLAIGVVPAYADPHGWRGGDGRGAGPPPGYGGERPGYGGGRPGYGGERPDFTGRPGWRGPPAEVRRGAEPPDFDRPRRRADQDRARDQMRAGAIRPLRDIQQQWRQGMPGYDFLGSDYDPGAGSYRLKFLRDGSVLWIDVDGRTGREIGRRGR